MTAVKVVKFPGSTRVVLGDEALALVADALEFTAEDSRSVARVAVRAGHFRNADTANRQADLMELLAEAVRASRDVALNMEDVDQDAGRSIARDLGDIAHDLKGKA